MDDNNKKERHKLYAETRTDLLNRQLSNSELYDRSILTLSTSALGISLAFIKDIVSPDKAQCTGLLVISWWLFGLAIISTMLSFWASQKGIETQLDNASKYYLEGKDEHLTKINIHAKRTECLNCLSGTSFIMAIVLTIVFVSINI